MHTHTFPARLIKIATKYPYSHVGLSLEKDCNQIYSFGRKKWNSFIDCGFTIEEKNGNFFQKFNKTICKIYELPVTEKQYKKIKKHLQHMKKNQAIYKYDFIGLILKIWDIPTNYQNRYVCSYFVASILQKFKVYQFDKNLSLVKPKDFECIPLLKEIYNGYFSKYQ